MIGKTRGRHVVITVFGVSLAAAFACTSVDGFSTGGGDGGDDGGSSGSSGTSDSAANDGSSSGGDTGGPTCNADLMTSKDHCGRCNHSCLGAECTLGKCEVLSLAVSQEAPSEIVVDGDSVYWRSAGNGKVLRVSKNGGMLPAIIACGTIPGIAHANGYLYSHCFCTLGVTPDDGGPTVEAPSHCGEKLITLDDNAAYVAAQGPQAYRRQPRDYASIADAGELALGSYGNGEIYAIAHQGGLIFHTYAATDTGPGRVAYVSTSAGARTPLSPLEAMPRGLAVDDAGAAWVALGATDEAGIGSPDAGLIRTQKLAGEAAKTVALLTPQPYAIAIDQDYVYFASVGTVEVSYRDAGIYRARRDGTGGPELLALNETKVEGIAVDGEAVYWTSRFRTNDAGGGIGATGSVKKVAKP